MVLARLLFALALSLLIAIPAVYGNERAANIVDLVTYHDKPPFIIDIVTEQGLYFDLARYLSQKHPELDFVTIVVPRKRLDHMIENNQLNGVVIGIDPKWFGDNSESQYLWLPSLLEDRDEFISLKTTPFEYVSETSFNDKVVVAVAGLYYFGINEAVAQNRLLRIDTINEPAVLELIKKERADFGIVSRSMLNYLRRTSNISPVYHLSARPHDAFSRRAFVLTDQKELHKAMYPLINGLANDPVWHAMLGQYQ